MKKLLFVINTMGIGGAERAMVELMYALPEEVDISLQVMIPRGEVFAQLPERVHVLGRSDVGSVLDKGGRRAIARTAVTSFFRYGAGFRLLPRLLHNYRAMRRSGRVQPDKLLWRLFSDGAPRPKESYDMAVAYLEGAASYFVADHVKAKHKVAFVHIDYVDAGYTKELDQGCYDDMERIYGVSKEVCARFLSVYPEYQEKVQVFHNLIGAERVRNLAEEGEGFADDFAGTRLLSVGRLHPQKAYDIAIPAMARLCQTHGDLRWYVLGEGAERESLTRLIHESGLDGRFVLLGAKKNPYPYMKQADLYLHATRDEGKAIAIEDAQVRGKAIIASDCTGNREQVISGEDGLLIELSEDNIVAAVEHLLEHPEEKARLERASCLKQTGSRRDVDALLALMKEEGEPCSATR